jgi:transglutaminase-like putative cysteine protease
MYVFFAKGGFSAVNDFVQTRSLGVRSESLRQVSSSAMIFVQWLPMIYLPFMLALVYSHVEKLPWTTFSFLYQRQHEAKRKQRYRFVENIRFNPSYPYLVIIFMASSATATNERWFFIAMSGLVLWAIFPFRNRRYQLATWASVFGICIVLAFGAQLGFSVLQKQIQLLQNRFINQFGQAQFDQSESRTAIGSVGRLHQSNKIILRVSTPEDESPPGLLREAAFNIYSGPFWTAAKRGMQIFAKTNTDSVWILNSNAAPRRAVSVLRYSTRSEANLAMPNGPIIIDNLEAIAVETNRLGAARALEALRVVTYDVRYGSEGGFSDPPEDPDWDLHRTQLGHLDRQAFEQVSDELGLHHLSEQDSIQAIRAFFLSDFTYSTFQQTRDKISRLNDAPLASFLLDHRTGHCEYYATATVHLLRMAGIPARYAVGYSVQEKTDDGEWLARSRHAHAWALAWIDGRWQEIDNTPSNWNTVEEASAGFWQPISDWFSDVYLEFNRWRQGDSQMRIYVFAAGVLVLGFMAWRQVSGKRWSRANQDGENRENQTCPGLDSEFYQIESELGRQLAPREQWEPMGNWIERLQTTRPDLSKQIEDLLSLHNQLRFDPNGLSDQARARLSRGVQSWLKRESN